MWSAAAGSSSNLLSAGSAGCSNATLAMVDKWVHVEGLLQTLLQLPIEEEQLVRTRGAWHELSRWTTEMCGMLRTRQQAKALLAAGEACGRSMTKLLADMLGKLSSLPPCSPLWQLVAFHLTLRDVAMPLEAILSMQCFDDSGAVQTAMALPLARQLQQANMLGHLACAMEHVAAIMTGVASANTSSSSSHHITSATTVSEGSSTLPEALKELVMDIASNPSAVLSDLALCITKMWPGSVYKSTAAAQLVPAAAALAAATAELSRSMFAARRPSAEDDPNDDWSLHAEEFLDTAVTAACDLMLIHRKAASLWPQCEQLKLQSTVMKDPQGYAGLLYILLAVSTQQQLSQGPDASLEQLQQCQPQQQLWQLLGYPAECLNEAPASLKLGGFGIIASSSGSNSTDTSCSCSSNEGRHNSSMGTPTSSCRFTCIELLHALLHQLGQCWGLLADTLEAQLRSGHTAAAQHLQHPQQHLDIGPLVLEVVMELFIRGPQGVRNNLSLFLVALDAVKQLVRSWQVIWNSQQQLSAKNAASSRRPALSFPLQSMLQSLLRCWHLARAGGAAAGMDVVQAAGRGHGDSSTSSNLSTRTSNSTSSTSGESPSSSSLGGLNSSTSRGTSGTLGGELSRPVGAALSSSTRGSPSSGASYAPSSGTSRSTSGGLGSTTGGRGSSAQGGPSSSTDSTTGGGGQVAIGEQVELAVLTVVGDLAHFSVVASAEQDNCLAAAWSPSAEGLAAAAEATLRQAAAAPAPRLLTAADPAVGLLADVLHPLLFGVASTMSTTAEQEYGPLIAVLASEITRAAVAPSTAAAAAAGTRGSCADHGASSSSSGGGAVGPLAHHSSSGEAGVNVPATAAAAAAAGHSLPAGVDHIAAGPSPLQLQVLSLMTSYCKVLPQHRCACKGQQRTFVCDNWAAVVLARSAAHILQVQLRLGTQQQQQQEQRRLLLSLPVAVWPWLSLLGRCLAMLGKRLAMQQKLTQAHQQEIEQLQRGQQQIVGVTAKLQQMEQELSGIVEDLRGRKQTVEATQQLLQEDLAAQEQLLQIAQAWSLAAQEKARQLRQGLERHRDKLLEHQQRAVALAAEISQKHEAVKQRRQQLQQEMQKLEKLKQHLQQMEQQLQHGSASEVVTAVSSVAHIVGPIAAALLQCVRLQETSDSDSSSNSSSGGCERSGEPSGMMALQQRALHELLPAITAWIVAAPTVWCCSDHLAAHSYHQLLKLLHTAARQQLMQQLDVQKLAEGLITCCCIHCMLHCREGSCVPLPDDTSDGAVPRAPNAAVDAFNRRFCSPWLPTVRPHQLRAGADI